MTSPTFDGINIVVADMSAAVDFYQRLGIEVQQPPEPWSGHHRRAGSSDDHAVDLDSSAFASFWDQGWEGGRTGVVFNFRVADRGEVDRIHAEMLAAGYAAAQPPYDAFWGARYAVFVDPSGNHVSIMSPPDPSMLSAPPNPATF